MGRHGYTLTNRDVMRFAFLDGASWHLDRLARAGRWDAGCDRLHDRLGRFGLGRN